MQRSLRFGSALARADLNATYRSGHPGVTVMWLGVLGAGPRGLEPLLRPEYLDFRLLETAPGFLDALSAARGAMVLATAALAALAIVLACRLLGTGAGLLGGSLLVLDPYLIGMSRVLHVDALLAPLMTVSALAALLYWTQGRKRRDLALSAVAGGLALLTKAPAVYSLLFFALVGGEPHTWSNFFLGQVLFGDPGPLYYPVALAFRLGPVTLAGLLAVLAVVWRRRPGSGPAVWLGLYVVLFIGVMSLGAKKLDRYMLPAIMVSDLLAGAGLWYALSWLRSARLPVLAAAALVGAQVMLLWQAQPYPLAFYNPVLGGAGSAQRTILVGWGEGLEQAADYLNAKPDAERLSARTLYSDALRPLFHGVALRLGEPRPADYLVVYVNMTQRELIPFVDRRVVAEESPEFTVTINGLDYARIYRVTGVPQAPGDNPPGEEADKD
jgi:hypothetical protein